MENNLMDTEKVQLKLIPYDSGNSPQYELEGILFDLDKQIYFLSSHADGLDCLVAVASGVLCGLAGCAMGILCPQHSCPIAYNVMALPAGCFCAGFQRIPVSGEKISAADIRETVMRRTATHEKRRDGIRKKLSERKWNSWTERKRRAAVCGLLLSGMLLSLTCCSGWGGEDRTAYSESFFAMDTYLTFTAYGANAEYALRQAESRITELESLWSVTDAGSDIYAVNHSGGQPVAVSGETERLVSFALEMAENTGGALEPTIYPVLTAWGFTTEENRVPSREEIAGLLESVGYDRVYVENGKVSLEAGTMLDLGAVGKGWAGDEAVQVLKENGVSSALLDIGGNIQTIGTKPDGSDWRVGLKDPSSGGVLGVIRVADQAVVTSGSYERYFVGEDGKRYGHIIDPDTGYPVDNGVASVTVIAGEGKMCDALSTALFVMGRDRAEEYWRQHRDFEMILVMEDGEIYVTEGIKDRFSLESESGDISVDVIRTQL